MAGFKVTGRVVSLVREQNSFLFTLQSPTTKDDKGKDVEGVVRKAVLSLEAAKDLTAIGITIPKVGDSVNAEPSINQTTGQVSTTWVQMSL